MAQYQSAWRLGWATASLLGVCLALLLWPAGAVVLLFAFAAATAALVIACGHDSVDSDGPGALGRWLRLTAVRAGAVGAGAVAAAAVASVSPLILVFLLLLTAATSPRFMGLVRAHVPHREQSRSDTRPEQAQVWSAVVASAARALTDHDLCRAWYTSFDVLQSVSDVEARARVVSLRQAYLDELDRRDPLGLSAWLASGARATGNPDRYLSRPGLDRQRDD